MLQKFFKYIFQSMAGMLGISVYILADTYFISVYSGADGLAVLNLILPVYGLIYAIGAMIGIGSATRYAIDRAQGKNASFYFLSAVTWDILISIPLVLAGTEIRFCSAEIVIRQFPVKSSAPVQTTSANPAGNTSAEAIRDAEAFVIAAEATEAPAPASAMNIPAKKPSISI